MRILSLLARSATVGFGLATGMLIALRVWLW